MTHGFKKEEKSQLPVLLFVHGAWHSSWYWDVYFMDYFRARGFKTYALDLRHHGNNSPNRVMNKLKLSDYVNDLKTAVDAIQQPIILIGHSMGGAIIQKYLEQYSAQAAILMATIPSSGTMKATFNFFKHFPTRFINGILRMDLYQIVKDKKHAKWAFYDNNISEVELAQYTNKLQRESFRAYLQMLVFKVKNNYHTQIPMLVLAAEQDNLFSIKEQQKTAQKYNADYQLIKDTAHNLMLNSNWKVSADAIISWIEKKTMIIVVHFIHLQTKTFCRQP